MERFGGTFLIAGVITFFLGFFLQGIMPVITLRSMPIKTVAEVAGEPTADFIQLAADYPNEFRRYFGEVNSESHIRAVTLGKQAYISEACWHCHSQFVRPVSNEDLRFGPVSTSAEYQDEMNLPHLFGTRRVGPDLSREAGKHSNDWHLAHLYEPRSVSPYSVMPGYPWFFDDERRPNERGLAVTAYMQWLGSATATDVPATIYDSPAGSAGAAK
jgi:hypothetical protein